MSIYKGSKIYVGDKTYQADQGDHEADGFIEVLERNGTTVISRTRLCRILQAEFDQVEAITPEESLNETPEERHERVKRRAEKRREMIRATLEGLGIHI